MWGWQCRLEGLGLAVLGEGGSGVGVSGIGAWRHTSEVRMPEEMIKGLGFRVSGLRQRSECQKKPTAKVRKPEDMIKG